MKLGFVGPLPPYHDGIADYNGTILSAITKHNIPIISYLRQKNVSMIKNIDYIKLPLRFKYKNIYNNRDKLPDLFHLGIGGSYPSTYVYRFFNLLKEKKHLIVSTLHASTTNNLSSIIIRSYRTIGTEPSTLFYNLSVPKTEDIIIRSDKIIVLSKFVKDMLIKKYPEYYSKIEVIPICANVSDVYIQKSKDGIREKLLIDKNSFVIVSFGSVTPGKGFEEVIKSIKLLKERGINVNYYLLGSFNFFHYKLKLRLLIKKLDLEDSIQLKGYIPFETVKLYLRAADVIVQPRKGRLDESSSSLVTSLASGTPVVSNTNDVLNDYLENEKNCLVVSYSANDFADKIAFLYNNQELGTKLGNNAIDWCKQNVDCKIIAKKHLELYRKLIK